MVWECTITVHFSQKHAGLYHLTFGHPIQVLKQEVIFVLIWEDHLMKESFTLNYSQNTWGFPASGTCNGLVCQTVHSIQAKEKFSYRLGEFNLNLLPYLKKTGKCFSRHMIMLVLHTTILLSWNSQCKTNEPIHHIIIYLISP